MTLPEASIIVPVYNRPDDIMNLFSGLSRQTRTDFEVVLVDDCSDEPIQERLHIADYPFSVRVMRHERNGGAGKARNTGVANAQAAMLIFVDSDADVSDAGWFGKFMALYQDARAMAAISGKERFVFHSEVCGLHRTCMGRIDTYSNWFGSCMTKPCQISDRHVPMNNTAMDRSLFEVVGLFSEALHLGEDIEWCFRCHDKDIGLFYLPGAPIGHFDRNTVRDVWRHYYRIGEYSPIIRALRPTSPYRWLFPRNRFMAVLLFLPLTVLKTLYITHCWVRRDPTVLFFMPGIYMTNVAYYFGMYKTINDTGTDHHEA